MSPLIALAIGIVIGWALMKRRCARLEKFVIDPNVHAELVKFVLAHAERDRAMKMLDTHRKFEQSIFGKLDPLSEDATAKIPASSREQWSASLDRAATEEQHVIAAYHAWHAYNARMRELIAHHRVNPELQLRLVQDYGPQVFPHG